jgi:mxaA protein
LKTVPRSAFVVAAAVALSMMRLAGGEEAATSAQANEAPPAVLPPEDTPAATAAVAGPPPNAVVQEPRAFGYVLGDVATQRVLLEEGGRAFTPKELPTPGPAGNWVERRAVRVESGSRGQRWLAVDYQIMNSPQTLTAVTLPAWKLTSSDGKGELRVGEWRISVAPLTPQRPFAQGGLGELRPDRSASLVDVAPRKQAIALWVTTLFVIVMAWLAWWAWRNWRASASQPFARALRELRGLDESAPQAWHALHRAFDGTAGRVVQGDALDALFLRAPQLAPQRSAIEHFFAQSGARFFGTPAPAGALSVHALCAELRRIEKRHEP